MNTHPLSEAQIAQFDRDGYLVCKSYYDQEEMDLLLRTARSDHNMLDHHIPIKDTAGRQSKLSLWNHPGDDIYGMISRGHRMVDAAEQLLRDEVYHYHSKMMLKEPKVGGAWEWHQDYGYWYQNGCLLPDMLSGLIAVDRATKENGCLQVLKGTQKLGRIEHGRFGEQTGADPQRVEQCIKRFELVFFEAEPGDVLFFHGNVLHASAPNTSPNPRWSLICCYNTKTNDPYKDSHHPRYTPLKKVDDDMIKKVGAKGSGGDQQSFLDPARDETIGTAKNQPPMNPLDLDYLPRLPMDKSPGIGCVGAGFIMADCQLVAYRNAGFNPVAIASKSRDHAAVVAQRHNIPNVYADYHTLLQDPRVQVVDIAVPPDIQLDVVRAAVKHAGKIKGILAQKPLGVDYSQAKEIVRLCEQSGIRLTVNQNMRYDQSIRACKDILSRGFLGDAVLATIDMRAIPHWMPWQQRLGWVTLRIMSIHHLDAFRFLFGDPQRVFCSTRPDPRTQKQFAHHDGICLYILEYANGLRACAWDDVWAGPAKEGAQPDIYLRWRVEGTAGMARGTIGWPSYPTPTPSTLDFTTTSQPGWQQPRWKEVWFPDAFAGPMAELLCAIETNTDSPINGRDNLKTMALVEACYQSAREHRAVELSEYT